MRPFSLFALVGVNLLRRLIGVRADQNVTVQSTDPAIRYLPALCNVQITAGDPIPSNCEGLWWAKHMFRWRGEEDDISWRSSTLLMWRTVVFLPNVGANITTTDGPSPSFADGVPQLFLTFKGEAQWYVNMPTLKSIIHWCRVCCLCQNDRVVQRNGKSHLVIVTFRDSNFTNVRAFAGFLVYHRHRQYTDDSAVIDIHSGLGRDSTWCCVHGTNGWRCKVSTIKSNEFVMQF